MKSNRYPPPPTCWQRAKVVIRAGLVVGLCVVLGPSVGWGAPGDLDLTFNAGGAINKEIRAIAVQTNGNILIGGNFTAVHRALRTGFARLNPDGSPDEAFNVVLGGSNPAIYAILNQAGGKYLIGGSFTSVNGIVRSNLARLNFDGSVDLAYSNALTPVSLLARQEDGKVLVKEWGGRMARYYEDGSLDESFLVLLEQGALIHSMAIQDDGKILLAGIFNTVNGSPRSGLARLNSDGSLDESFLAEMSGPFPYTTLSVCVQPDRKILVGGY